MKAYIYLILYKILHCKLTIGKGVRFKGLPIIVVTKGSSVRIGNGVSINSSVLSNLLGLYQRTIICARTSDAVIDIGNNVGMSGVTVYARNHICIGENTAIGANTKIMDNDFHPIDPEQRLISRNSNIKTRPIIIGKNVFIGCNCIILKGTQIGDGSIIGAGSVVSGVIPENCIAAGNPARVINTLT